VAPDADPDQRARGTFKALPARPPLLTEVALAHEVGSDIERAYRRTDLVEWRREVGHDTKRQRQAWCSKQIKGRADPLDVSGTVARRARQRRRPYRRTDLFEKRRALMRDWADFVTGTAADSGRRATSRG
jgi:hypothetical protein